MKRQKAKPVKLNENELICFSCDTILSIDEDIITDEFIQCANCEKIISNPFFLSGKFVNCGSCSKRFEIPRKLENTLNLNCPNCNSSIYNPHSEEYDGVICPECNHESHLIKKYYDDQYLQCPNCNFDNVLNPYFKKVRINGIHHDSSTDADNLELAQEREQFPDKLISKSNSNYFWIALVVLGSIVLLTIGYISDRNTQSFSHQSPGLATRSAQNWYEGGTLHKANVSDWKRATVKDKLATCADFISSNRPNFTNQELRSAANELKNSIDESIRGNSDFNHESVATIAVLCMTLQGYID